jgi:hypothetical protein
MQLSQSGREASKVDEGMHGHGTPNRDKSSFLHDLPDILEVSLTHAKQVPGGDVHQAILLNQKLALRSLHARR